MRRKPEALHLHSHDLLVGAYDLVADLEEHVEGQLSTLGCHDRRVEFLALSGEESLGRSCGILPEGLHGLDGTGENVLKRATPLRLPSRANRVRKRGAGNRKNGCGHWDPQRKRSNER